MNIDFVEIREYLNNKNVDFNKDAILYSIVIGILMILLIVSLSLIKTYSYYINKLVIKNNQVLLIVNYHDINKIVENDILIINDNIYRYRISNIEMVTNDSINYQVSLIIDLDKYNLNNVVLDYKIKLNEESILRYVVRVIKGG